MKDGKTSTGEGIFALILMFAMTWAVAAVGTDIRDRFNKIESRLEKLEAK